MSRYPEPRSVTKDQHTDTPRDQDSRLIYPGVAGFNPLGSSRRNKLNRTPRRTRTARGR